MNRAVYYLILLSFFFVSNTSANTNLLVLGEDGDKDSVSCDSRVFKRVMSALNLEMNGAGFDMYDESAVASDHPSFGRCRRSQQELIDVAKSIYKSRIDIAVIFQIYATTTDKKYLTKANVRITGRLLDVQAGRRLGSFEVNSPKEWSAPAQCDRECVLETLGKYSSYLARDLGAVLAEILVDQTGDPLKDMPAGNQYVNEYFIKLSGLNDVEKSAFADQLKRMDGAVELRVSMSGKSHRLYSYKSTASAEKIQHQISQYIHSKKLDLTLSGNEFVIRKQALGRSLPHGTGLQQIGRPPSSSDKPAGRRAAPITVIPVDEPDSGKLKVAWAGFSLAGPAKDVAKLYPYSSRLQDNIRGYLVNKAATINSDHYELITRKASRRQGESLSVTLALDDEVVVVRKLLGVYQVVVEISATLLVFDFDKNERSIIASYPISSVDFIETFKSRPSKQQLIELVEGYWFGTLDLPAGQEIVGILDSAIEVLGNVAIKQKYAAECGVGKVTVSKKALDKVHPVFGNDVVSVQRYLARQFSRKLSSERQVSIIPFIADSSIAAMALRIDGEPVSTLLRFPKPDYLVDIDLVNLAARQVTDEDQRIFVHGARINFTFYDAFMTELLNVSLAEKAERKTVISQTKVDDWGLFSAAISKLNSTTVKQFEKTDKTWMIDFQRYNDKQFTQYNEGFRLAQRGFDQCR